MPRRGAIPRDSGTKAAAPAANLALAGMIETRPCDTLAVSPLNPRKRVDEADIASLAESIAAKGVLQNLVVRPARNGAGAGSAGARFEIAAGERRWRAVQHLVEAGRAAADYPMPVRIVPMSDVELVEFAMTENLQRRDMTPLEEADGFAWLVGQGRDAETIAAETGYRLRLIRQRLVLHYRLASPVRQALDQGTISLGQAQAFTLAEHERQAEILAAVVRQPHHYDAAQIRALVTERLIPLSRAIFPREAYKGARRKDLFAPLADDAEEEWAEDRAEFARLQREAAAARRDQLALTWSWAELKHGGWINLAEYGRDDRPSIAGAIVHLRDDLRIEIHTGLVRRPPAAFASTRNAKDPAPQARQGSEAAANRSPGKPFTKAHLAWARQEKTRALQLGIADHPAVAMSLAILGLIGSQEIKLYAGSGYAEAPADRIDNPALMLRIDADLLRVKGERTHGEAVLLRKVLAMSHERRTGLFAALLARHCGTWPGWEPELGDSPLACAIAAAIGLDRAPFELTTGYLERLSKARLVALAREIGAELPGDPAHMTRGALIDTIALSPTGDRGWMPPELRFGAAPELLNLIAGE